MGNDVAIKDKVDGKILEALVLHADIKSLTPQAKVDYYLRLCESLDLNPASNPFQVIAFQGREQLYAKKDATDQLRDRRGISVTDLEARECKDIYVVTVKGRDAKGRTDAAVGAVSIKGLTGDALANAMMKAETKAKRRLTLSLGGLGILDESEIETVPGVKEIKEIDTDTGETRTVRTEETPTPAPPKAKRPATLRDQIGRLVMDASGHPINGFSKDEIEKARKFCNEHGEDDIAMAAELKRLTELSAGARAALNAEASVGFGA